MNHQHKDTQQQELSREFLLQMLNGISDPIFVKNRQHSWVVLNDAFCNFIGYSREELIGKSDYDFFPQAEADVFWEKDELVFTTGVTNESKEHFTNAAGINHVISTKKFLFADELGNKFIVGTIQDITQYQQIEVELEKRVEKRTEELAQTNQLLLQEVLEHRQTEVALRQSEAKLQKLAANVPGMLYQFMLQPDGSVSFPYVSSGCYEIYELRSEQIQADAYSMISRIHQDDRQNFEQSVGVSAQTLQPWQWEGQMILSSGKLKWVKALSRPEKQTNGAIVWHGVLLDISDEQAALRDRKRVEAELKASQQRLSLLIEQTPVVIIEWDLNFHVKTWNPAAEKIFGYTKQEAVGRNFEFIVPEATKTQVQQITDYLLSQKGGSYSVNENITKDDKIIVCEWFNNSLISVDGELVGIASVVVDITKRKQAEEEQQKFVALIENSRDFIGIASMDGQVIYVNPAGMRMVGLSNIEEAKTKTIGDFHSPEDFAQFSQKIAPSMIERGFWQGESHYRHIYTGEITPADCNSFVVKHPETGEPFCLVAVFRDITERKEAETVLRHSEAQLRVQTQELENTLHELQRTQSQLIQSEKMSSLGQLVAGVAHEINNPVNFIFGNLAHASGYIQDLLQLLQLYQQNYPQPMSEIADFAKLIELDFLQSDLPQLLNSMKVGADRIREIVLSLRTFSRLDEAEMKAVDIHQGIDSTLMILQSRLKANAERQEIQVIKEYCDLPLVECYAGQLNQVFMNILANAIDALEESLVNSFEQRTNPQIRICTEVVAANKVTIRIADNGSGMPEEVKQRLFDPFFTTKPVGKGTGMGLSISYQIVSEKHRGCLECLSESGKGTEFLITIPLIQQGKISNL